VWDGGVGFVSKEMIQAHCPAPAHDVKVIVSLFHILLQNGVSMFSFANHSVEGR